jgi:hypothetical protein
MLSKKETFTEGVESKDADVPDNISRTANVTNAVDTQVPEKTADPNKLQQSVGKFFSKDNFKMLVTFLGIFVILYVLLGMYFYTFGRGSQDSLISFVNAMVLLIVATTATNKYYNLDDDSKNHLLEYIYATFKSNIKDIEFTFELIVKSAFIFGINKMLHLPTPEGRGSFALDLSNFVILSVLLLNIFVIFCIDLLNIPIIKIYEDIKNYILYGEDKNKEDKNKEDTNAEDIPNNEIKLRKITPQPAEEVFNVSNNLYTFEDAPHVCSALGARLASYDEVEDAYNKGADWCSYGWSENQMGFFPTQKETWDKLQSNNALKNSCGRPGVNGGYMKNPKMRLGVNCYGKKPQASELDKERMATSNIVPRTRKDVITERKVAFWKDNADKMLNLNPHSKGDWSTY